MVCIRNKLCRQVWLKLSQERGRRDDCPTMREKLLARRGQRWKLESMTEPVSHPLDPLHGITLEKIINELVQRHGWGEMGRRIPIRCFQFNPTVKSSLTFLRKTPWARKKVEDWYIGEMGT